MKTTKMLTILVLVMGLMVCLTGVSKAEEPMGTAFTYQGWLMKGSQPADGLHYFEFELFDGPDPSSNKLEDTIVLDNVDIIDGHFVVELDFGSDVFKGNARWLKISVREVPPGGSPADPNIMLSPWQELTPTPYAIYAETAGGDNDWMVSVNDMYSIPSGNVGIGTTNPAVKLDVNGDGYFRGGNLFVASPIATARTYEIRSAARQEIYNRNDFVHFSGSNVAFVLNSDEFGGGGNNEFFIYDGNTSNIKFILEGTSGNVGIGTASPEDKLDVRGGIHFRNSDTILAGELRTMVSDEPDDYDEELVICLGASADDRSSIFIGPNPAGALAPKGRVQINAKKLIIYHANVGIGTENPAYKLDVEGDVQAHAYHTGDIFFQKDGKKLWRMFEDEDGLYLENLKTGNVYSFVLQERKNKLDVNRVVNLDQAIGELQAENQVLKQRLDALERTIQQQHFAAAKEVQQ